MERKPEERKPEKHLPEESILPEEENINNLDLFSSSNTSSSSAVVIPEYKIVIRENDFLLFDLITGRLIGNFPIQLIPNNLIHHSAHLALIRIGTHTGKAIIFKSKKKRR